MQFNLPRTTNKEGAITIGPVGSVVVGLWLSFGLSNLNIHPSLLHHMTNSVLVLRHLRSDHILKKKTEHQVTWVQQLLS